MEPPSLLDALTDLRESKEHLERIAYDATTQGWLLTAIFSWLTPYEWWQDATIVVGMILWMAINNVMRAVAKALEKEKAKKKSAV